MSDTAGETLDERIVAAFADGGPLAAAMPAFEPRPSQREMAAAVGDILADGGVLLAEAGTGTGKTLAYLVPAILSGRRVLVSTGTRNLQDQIYYKDLPALREALGVPFTAAYMKGRANYLCLQRFESVLEDSGPRGRAGDAYIDTLREWAEQTETGDRSEVEDLPDDYRRWNEISAASENCIGTECPRYDDCFVTRMRRQALESDLVIVNHHLLCADAAVRQGAYGEVIPSCACTVIDEAHQLEDVATQYFGASVSNYRLEELERDGKRVLAGIEPAGAADGDEARRRVDDVRYRGQVFAEALRSLVPEGDRIRVTTEMLEPATEPAGGLAESLAALERTFRELADATEELAALARRAAELREQIRFLLDASDTGFVYFLERRGKGVFLRAAPIDVSDIVRELILERADGTVLTSATLAVDDTFDYFRGRLGITDAHEMRLPPEYDFAAQAVLYLPRHMPAPPQRAVRRRHGAGARRAAARHARPRVRAVHQLRQPPRRSRAARPGAALSAAGPGLGAPFGAAARVSIDARGGAAGHLELLAGRGRRGRSAELRRHRQAAVRLPVRPGDGGAHRAIEADGGNAFAEYQVPLAILTLLQGFGRLLRHRSDRGVLALFDARVRTRGYGRRFLASLPPAPITHEIDAVRSFFGTDGDTGTGCRLVPRWM